MDLNNCQLKVMQENFLNFYEQIGNNNKISPNIIAGPCAMESAEDVPDTSGKMSVFCC